MYCGVADVMGESSQRPAQLSFHRSQSTQTRTKELVEFLTVERPRVDYWAATHVFNTNWNFE